jgi:diketogulonate reductase-like aldo/keto reductase
LNRAEVFVTSKLPAEVKSHNDALDSFEATMDAIKLDYLDLYLIHAPWPWARMGADFSEQNKAVWLAFEKIYAAGRVRAIGVSNFNVKDLTSLRADCRVSPMVNQIKFFIGNTQNQVVDYCRREDIQVEGYSPFATGAIFGDADISRLAKQYGKSVAQICVRYVVQKGIITLPKTLTKERMIENADVEFVIADKDMKFLDGLENTVPEK